jgi:hypothetical protein
MIDNAIEGRTDETTRFGTSWLIVRGDVGAGGGPPEVLTLGAGGGVEGHGTILPVFSCEEEALLFLRLCGFGGRWHASKSGIADLASVLSDARSEVRSVALDPILEIGTCGPRGLFSLSREEFVGLLAAGRYCFARASAPPPAPGHHNPRGPDGTEAERETVNGASLTKASPA